MYSNWRNTPGNLKFPRYWLRWLKRERERERAFKNSLLSENFSRLLLVASHVDISMLYWIHYFSSINTKCGLIVRVIVLNSQVKLKIIWKLCGFPIITLFTLKMWDQWSSRWLREWPNFWFFRPKNPMSNTHLSPYFSLVEKILSTVSLVTETLKLLNFRKDSVDENTVWS